jgi:hypothetical protein
MNPGNLNSYKVWCYLQKAESKSLKNETSWKLSLWPNKQAFLKMLLAFYIQGASFKTSAYFFLIM